jgi:hypothetical protein
MASLPCCGADWGQARIAPADAADDGATFAANGADAASGEGGEGGDCGGLVPAPSAFG